jgi:hypothetical protein
MGSFFWEDACQQRTVQYIIRFSELMKEEQDSLIAQKKIYDKQTIKGLTTSYAVIRIGSLLFLISFLIFYLYVYSCTITRMPLMVESLSGGIRRAAGKCNMLQTGTELKGRR